MIVCGRGPYLPKGTFRHQAFALHSVPEGAADGPGVGSSVENSTHHFNFAGPRIPMLADVAVEAQRLVVAALTHALLLQKMNGQNGGVSAVAAAKRERSIFQIGER